MQPFSLNKSLKNSISLENEYQLQQMSYALYNIQLIRRIFHLYGYIAVKFYSRPVCVAFLKTPDLISLPISNGNSIFASSDAKFGLSFLVCSNIY